jgi:hypothetical protein
MVNSLKIISMEKESTNGQMDDNMMETGKKIKWMEKEFSLGLMEESYKYIKNLIIIFNFILLFLIFKNMLHIY